MRIFTAVRHSVNPAFYYGGLWSGNFYPALRQLGHELVESQVDLLPASAFLHIPSGFTSEELAVRTRLTEKIIEEVRHAHSERPLNLFLSYFYNSHFDPTGFDEIRRMGVPTVNFYCNSVYQFNLVSEIVRKVDFAWHAEKEARPLYLEAGANPVWVQMGADPDIYRPLPRPMRQNRACFVGQRYADRDRLIGALIKAEVPIDIFGAGWGRNGSKGASSMSLETMSHRGRSESRPATVNSYLQAVKENILSQGLRHGTARTYLQFQYRRRTRQLSKLFSGIAKGPTQDLVSTFADYEVVLNFSNVWADGRPGSKLIPHVRLRDFEAPMARACYLTGHTDEIAEFYEIGKEIVTYRSEEELIEKTKFYLSHPDEAERLREAGYRRARQDHTWVRRFEKLFGEIGLAKEK